MIGLPYRWIRAQSGIDRPTPAFASALGGKSTISVMESLTGRDPSTGESLIVHYADGCIAAIESGPPGEDVWLAPGLIDLQVNSYCGDDLNADDLSIDTLRSLARRMLVTCVTTSVITLITAYERQIVCNLRVIAAARAADPLLMHMIPLVHVNAPHIASEDGP